MRHQVVEILIILDTALTWIYSYLQINTILCILILPLHMMQYLILIFENIYNKWIIQYHLIIMKQEMWNVCIQ